MAKLEKCTKCQVRWTKNWPPKCDVCKKREKVQSVEDVIFSVKIK